MMAVAISGALLAALLLLALLPALAELRRPSDATPLHVPQDHDNKVQRFAQAYRARLEAAFGAPLAHALAAEGAGERARQRGFELLRPSAAAMPPNWQRPVACSADLHVPDGAQALELFAAGGLYLGAGSRVRAALCEGTARLERGVQIARWLHARRIVMAEGSAVQARASADEAIELAPGAECLRAHAPVIQARAVSGGPATVRTPGPLRHYVGERAQWDAAGKRWIVFGSLDLPPDTLVEGHLIVRGDARLGPGCRIDGSLKVHGRLSVGVQTHIAGACVAARETEIGAGCRIVGPVVCEDKLQLRADTVVGSASSLTTVSADEILLHPGARCHGTVWAKTRVRAV